MCGRVAQFSHANEFVPRLQREVPTLGIARFNSNENEQQGYRPRYNVGPKSNLPIIRRQNGENVLQIMNWSVVPHWTKHEPSYGDSMRTVNARSEALTGAEEPSPLWKSLCATKRCVVPVQGYYEWIDRGGKSGKIPHYIRNPFPTAPDSSSAQGQDQDQSQAQVVDGEAAPPAASIASSSSASTSASASSPITSSSKEPPFIYFAGLWDKVTYEELDSTPLYTFTILTTQSSPRLNFIHPRMPVMLRTEEDILKWLDCDPDAKDKDKRGTWSKELSALCKPFGRKGCDEDLNCYVVPQEVGKVTNQDESFIHPVSERKDGIERFFKKAAAAPPEVDPEPAASSSKRKVSDLDEDEVEEVPKGKEKVEIVLSDEDDEVLFVGETKKKETATTTTKSSSSSSSQPSSKKTKTSSTGSSFSSSQPKKTVKKKEKGKITSFFKPE